MTPALKRSNLGQQSLANFLHSYSLPNRKLVEDVEIPRPPEIRRLEINQFVEYLKPRLKYKPREEDKVNNETSRQS